MENDNKDLNQDSANEVSNWEAFFTVEDAQVWEKEKQQKRKRKKMIVKTVSVLLVFALFISGLEVWFNVFNIPALRFVEVSNRLSNQPEVKEYKKSVVTIEWDGVKGTGFNVDHNGLIVTNNHVVEHTHRVNVHMKSGNSYPGKVIANYPELDLAIVDIDANNLPFLPLSFDKEWEPKQGEKIIFIGNPLSFTQIANQGTILGNVLLKDWEIPVMMIEAPIYKGNSGSPVIDHQGEVIGVIFATLQNPNMATKEIIGAAIPSYHLEAILSKVTE